MIEKIVLLSFVVVWFVLIFIALGSAYKDRNKYTKKKQTIKTKRKK